MSLLESAKRRATIGGRPCAVQLLAKSDPKLHAELVEAIASDVPGPAIVNALAEDHGVRIHISTILRHRRTECAWCR